jgi:hypothetical protein
LFPPIRVVDHKISLIPRAKPVNIRLYKSSLIHKKEIEKLVIERL